MVDSLSLINNKITGKNNILLKNLNVEPFWVR